MKTSITPEGKSEISQLQASFPCLYRSVSLRRHEMGLSNYLYLRLLWYYCPIQALTASVVFVYWFFIQRLLLNSPWSPGFVFQTLRSCFEIGDNFDISLFLALLAARVSKGGRIVNDWQITVLLLALAMSARGRRQTVRVSWNIRTLVHKGRHLRCAGCGELMTQVH